MIKLEDIEVSINSYKYRMLIYKPENKYYVFKYMV